MTVVKPEGGLFSDGLQHSVIVTVAKKYALPWKRTLLSPMRLTSVAQHVTCLSPRALSIQVDEEHLKSIALLPGRFSHWSPASFFIGGVPLGAGLQLPPRLRAVASSFRGCIQHLVLGGGA